MWVSKSGNWRWPPDFSRWFVGRRVEREIRQQSAARAARLRAEFITGAPQPVVRPAPAAARTRRAPAGRTRASRGRR